jgi:hypothetical protein
MNEDESLTDPKWEFKSAFSPDAEATVPRRTFWARTSGTSRSGQGWVFHRASPLASAGPAPVRPALARRAPQKPLALNRCNADVVTFSGELRGNRSGTCWPRRILCVCHGTDLKRFRSWKVIGTRGNLGRPNTVRRHSYISEHGLRRWR